VMSMPNRRDAGDGPPLFDTGNLHLRALHPQTNRGSAPTPSPPWKGSRVRTSTKLALESQRRAGRRHRRRPFRPEPDPVHNDDGSVALDHEEFPRPNTTLEGLASLSLRSRPGRRRPQRGRPDLPLA